MCLCIKLKFAYSPPATGLRLWPRVWASRIVTGTEVAACQFARLSLSRFGDVFAFECVTTDVMGPPPPPISFLFG